ncbi:hypothetical protein [Pontibacillus marinus]|uniref:Uncharacterized protein n=1 Tax=Pontibacillus marinus BH030004 = DSM 16465 TaxID=1385511 RepID=A0A0A5I0Z2_9BACI|nr:hypothetical protein [Pontibacillus marinus]KGX89492.1 hypothetical protein N783_06255 [Pontibacillus marinus BH030004 = DSM 16465]
MRKSIVYILIALVVISAGTVLYNTFLYTPGQKVNWEKVELEKKALESKDAAVSGIVTLWRESDNEKIYLYDQGTDKVFGAFYIADKRYPLGQVSMKLGRLHNDIKHETLFGEGSYRVDGVMGSDSPITTYYKIENRQPYEILSIEAKVQELDINGDGQKEIISAPGAPKETKIYSYEQDSLQVAHLNDQLDAATSVTFDKPNRFLVYREEKGQTIYELQGDHLVKIKEE